MRKYIIAIVSLLATAQAASASCYPTNYWNTAYAYSCLPTSANPGGDYNAILNALAANRYASPQEAALAKAQACYNANIQTNGLNFETPAVWDGETVGTYNGTSWLTIVNPVNGVPGYPTQANTDLGNVVCNPAYDPPTHELCEDGEFALSGQCPPPPVTCWDESEAPTYEDCPPEPPQGCDSMSGIDKMFCKGNEPFNGDYLTLFFSVVSLIAVVFVGIKLVGRSISKL